MSDISFDDETVEFTSFASDEEQPATTTLSTEVDDAKTPTGACARRTLVFRQFNRCFKHSVEEPFIDGDPKRCYLSLPRLFWLFLTFGLRAWGGPVVQIDMQRTYFVDEVRWISKVRFNRVLAVYQALPGFVWIVTYCAFACVSLFCAQRVFVIDVVSQTRSDGAGMLLWHVVARSHRLCDRWIRIRFARTAVYVAAVVALHSVLQAVAKRVRQHRSLRAGVLQSRSGNNFSDGAVIVVLRIE